MSPEAITWNSVDSFAGNFTDEALLEYRSCPLCGEDDYDVVCKYEDFQFFSDSGEMPKRCQVQTALCRNCLCLYMNPAYTGYGFEILFSQASMSYGAPGGSREKIAPWLIERGFIKPGNYILDIGCGDGSFLNTFPDDMRKVGLDVDGPSIERARELFPHIRFINNSFENIKVDERPNAITLIHVLEHLPNPLATLRSLRSISSDETLLVIEVPVIEGRASEDVTGFFTMIHMQHFSKATLHSMLELAGWKITQATLMDDYNGYRVVARKSQPCDGVKPCPTDRDALRTLLRHEKAARTSLEERIRHILKTAREKDRIIIWGAGMHTEILYHKTSLFDAARKLDYLLLDMDPAKQGRTWRGIQCHDPKTVLGINDKCQIIISSYGNTPAILKMARELAPYAQICALYDAIVTR